MGTKPHRFNGFRRHQTQSNTSRRSHRTQSPERYRQVTAKSRGSVPAAKGTGKAETGNRGAPGSDQANQLIYIPNHPDWRPILAVIGPFSGPKMGAPTIMAMSATPEDGARVPTSAADGTAAAWVEGPLECRGLPPLSGVIREGATDRKPGSDQANQLIQIQNHPDFRAVAALRGPFSEPKRAA